MDLIQNGKCSVGSVRTVTGKACGLLVLLAALLLPTFALALEVEGNYHSLNSEFSYLEDPSAAVTIEDLLREDAQYSFSSSDGSKPSSVFQPIWLKLQLNFSESTREKKYFLFGSVGNFYDIRIYRPDEQGQYQEWVTGNDYPASSRELDALRYGFRVPDSVDSVTIFIRYIGGPGTNELPWDLIEENAYASASQIYYSLDVACFAAIGALFLFNLMIAISLRRAAYLYYSAFVLSVTLALATVDGIGFYYLWPDTPALNERALHSFNLTSAAMRLLAILSFLGIAKEAPRLHSASMLVLALLAVTLLCVNAVGITRMPTYAATIPWAIGILFGFLVCIVAIKRRVKLALPLFLTLLVPFVFAVLQASQSLQGVQLGMIELQLAKIGFVLHVMLFSLCLAAQIKIQAESHMAALHDELTGLPKSELLSQRFEWAADLARRQQWQMAVLFIDLDGFKQVNDTMGHHAGDRLLIQASARMQGVLRKTDYVARLGGDEFVVLLLNPQENFSIATVTEKLLHSIAKPYVLDGTRATISASIGVARYRDENEELATLLQEADAAMYEAKRKGKNTYVVARSQPSLELVKSKFSLVKS